MQVDSLREFINTKADKELMRDMHIARISNRQKRYLELKEELIKDYAEYVRQEDTTPAGSS